MKRTHLPLVAILLLHAVVAVLQQVDFWRTAPDGASTWMMSPAIYLAPLLLLLFIWCALDAKDRRVQDPFASALFASLLFPIGVPWYFVRTYPLRPAMIRIGWATLFAAACIAAAECIGHKDDAAIP